MSVHPLLHHSSYHKGLRYKYGHTVEYEPERAENYENCD